MKRAYFRLSPEKRRKKKNGPYKGLRYAHMHQSVHMSFSITCKEVFILEFASSYGIPYAN